MATLTLDIDQQDKLHCLVREIRGLSAALWFARRYELEDEEFSTLAEMVNSRAFAIGKLVGVYPDGQEADAA